MESPLQSAQKKGVINPSEKSRVEKRILFLAQNK
jgi:hypothetical protein